MKNQTPEASRHGAETWPGGTVTQMLTRSLLPTPHPAQAPASRSLTGALGLSLLPVPCGSGWRLPKGTQSWGLAGGPPPSLPISPSYPALPT